jgi:hypothetical protein
LKRLAHQGVDELNVVVVELIALRWRLLNFVIPD